MTHPNDSIPQGFCQCGCGQKTRIAPRTDKRCDQVRGQPIRFISGHNRCKTPHSSQPYTIEDRGFETPCWIWQRANDGRGYGCACVNGHTVTMYRRNWEQINGPVPSGHELHHCCQQEACIRPDHVEPLTHAEHMQRHGKLSADQVTNIRALAGTMSQRAIAQRFGVSQPNVSFILREKTWHT